MNHTLRSIIEAELEKAVLAEREACAKVCEYIATEIYGMLNMREYGECAAAIRARGENATDNN